MHGVTFSKEDGIACYFKKEVGPCILWLHGYTMSSMIWEKVWSYLPNLTHLAIDLPGHGDSRSIANKTHLPSLAREVISIAKKFSAEYIVGVSFGGLLGIQMAIEGPDNFKSLFLNSSPIGGGPIDPSAETKNIELIKLFKNNKREELTKAWMTSPPNIFKGARKHPDLWATLRNLINLHKWEELENNSFSAFTGNRQLKNDLEKIDFPIRLFIGEEDLDSIKRCGEIIKRSTKYCSRTYVPSAGHLALLEYPEFVTSLILSSIKDC